MTQFHRISGFVPDYVMLDVVRRNPESALALNLSKTFYLTHQLWQESGARKNTLFRFTGGGKADRRIYDAGNRQSRPGSRARFEGDAEHKDAVINKAYDMMGVVRAYYSEIHGRNSIDANGMPLSVIVHYGSGYNNAFWDGQYMTFGDGDGEIFLSFVDLNVGAHEMDHGVTEYAVPGGIEYWGMAGATNEAMSDITAAAVESRHMGVNAKGFHWLIGKNLWVPVPNGSKAVRRGLRDMLRPGTAYNDPRLGKDRQPDHMSKYVKTSSDNGGVHINSSIINRFFAEFAITLPGESWEDTMGKAARIVYAARPQFGNKPSFGQVAYWMLEACSIFGSSETDGLRRLMTAAANTVGIVPNQKAVDDLTPVASDDEIIIVQG